MSALARCRRRRRSCRGRCCVDAGLRKCHAAPGHPTTMANVCCVGCVHGESSSSNKLNLVGF